MKIAGTATVPAPVDRVWDALLDPAVLVRTIPGCSRLEETGPHVYAMTVTAGVAAIKGTYDGTCALTDLVPHESLVMRLQGAGAPGTVDATVQVRFAGDGETTVVSYDADATVGGMVGGVGQRMLTSVSRRMAGEFFGNVATALAGAAPAPPSAASSVPASVPSSGDASGAGRHMPAVYADPGRQPSRTDFLQGVAVGAGLVLLGVLAGARLGRRL